MRPSRLLFVAATVIGSIGLWLQSTPAAPPPRPSVAWQADLHAAHQIAVRDNKPMLLVFGAPWCGFCRKLESQTLSHADMARYVNATFVPVHLDLDKKKDHEVAEILEVESLPCTIILSPNADLLGRIEGYYEPSAFYRQLAAAKKIHSALPLATDASRTASAESVPAAH